VLLLPYVLYALLLYTQLYLLNSQTAVHFMHTSSISYTQLFINKT
jgi:hypothetical protein